MHIGPMAGLVMALWPAIPAIAIQAAPASMAPTDPRAALPGLTVQIENLPVLLASSSRNDEAFTPAFCEAVPRAQWQTMLARITVSAGKPLAIEHVDVTSPWSASVRVRFERALIGMRIAVEHVPPHRIAGLLVTSPVAAEASVPAVLDAIRRLPGSSAAAVARLGVDAPMPQQQFASERELSVGSEFKLVILSEVIRAIAAGERHWDDAVTIDGRPLPSGRYTALRPGTKVPLRELAQTMISVSDNSATDILIAILGRERIEAMLPKVGIARPAGMRPFLTTLEAFKLKAMIAAGQTDWLRADEAQRRRLLSGPVADMPLGGIDQAFAAGKPLSIESVEWRASSSDIIRVLDWIRRHTESGPAVEARTMLARNPGVGPDASAGWRYIGYKGGSEPGVIAMGFLMQRQSGEWLAVSAGWNDAANPLDEGRFVPLINRLVELLRTNE